MRLCVPGPLHALFGRVSALAKVHSAGELAHNLEIEVPEPVRFQGRNSSQRLEQFYGTNVYIQPQPLSQIEQSALRPLADGQRIPLRSADGSQKYGVGLAASVQSFVRKRRAGGVDGRAADGKFRELELMIKFLRGFAQDGCSSPRHFRADAVPRKQDNGLLHGDPRIERELWQATRMVQE